jgi:putative glycosyl hydrolase-like family 6 (GHL6) protein
MFCYIEFHRTLAYSCKNPILPVIMEPLYQLLEMSLTKNLKSPFILFFALIILIPVETYSQTNSVSTKGEGHNWIQTARIFLIDAYQPPFAPELEYDAKAVVKTMLDMNANVLRFGTMGKYATIQGIRFSVHPDQGDRDLLSETIDACKPQGIKVIPYISTGHKLAWSMVTENYPEYGQKTTPHGEPSRNHMYAGEDHGTVCWMTPYREAYLDYVEHVVRDYDIDGIYFDAWFPNYFWPDKQLCYCQGCKDGFRKATGLEIPYHENSEDYSAEEEETIEKYHTWYKEDFITGVVLRVREIVKSHKDIPCISNINNPEKMAALDPRIISAMDAFLYERGNTIVERAEGVSVARSLGLDIWPYIGVYHNWPRLAFQGYNYQQQIFTNLMFGGGSIIAQPTGYIDHPEHRKYVRYPFGIIKKNEEILKGLKNYPNVGVVYAYNSPDSHVQDSWLDGLTNARTSTLGAFSACLNGHIQVSSVSEFVLDNPESLKKYPVLYLANIPHLSAKRIHNIQDYVRNGGNLVASYATTLFDSTGNRQTRFDLENLFKVKPIVPSGELALQIKSYQAMLGGPNDLYLTATKEGNKVFKEKWQSRLFPLWFYEPVEVLDGGKVLMNIVLGHKQQSILPGVVISDYGEGQVIYCASALESLYNSGGQDLVQELILKFIASINNNPVPYKLDAPVSLIANLVSDENRMILHLTNWTGNKHEHPWRNEYYIAPVENVRLQIHIPENKKVKDISTIVEADYTKTITGQNLELFFPRVESYQAVLVEFEPEQY